MFFVVMPMAGALIQERVNGTIVRLAAAPAPAWTRLVGLLLVYALVCLAQLALVLIIGTTLLPALGSTTLELGQDPLALVVIAVSASLAAAGFGLAVGCAVRSYQQVSAFAPLAVVIAAALGGVMVPAYLMPHGLKAAGRLFPLSWGHEAFLAIMVRGAGLAEVLPLVGLLLAFAAATVTLAVASTLRRERSGLWTGSSAGGGF
jgi:ABC-2 type transport system permease protein